MTSAPVALLLAGGASRRLGEPKALVRFAGQTLLKSRIAATAAATGRPVYVALGHDAATLEPPTVAAGGKPLHCPGWNRGMGQTLAEATAQLAEAQQLGGGLLVLAVDQYRLLKSDLVRLLGAFAAAPDQPCVAVYAGTLGLPVIFPGDRCSILGKLTASRGAKDWLLRQPSLSRVSVERAAWDLDTPQDLAALRAAEPSVLRQTPGTEHGV